MVYQRQMPGRSLPPERLRAIRKNQTTISQRNLAVDAGKSAYVRGKTNGLVAVPKGKPAPGQKRNGKIGNDYRDKNKPGNPESKAMAARNAAIKSNQRTLSARNMAVDAGKSTYVRGKSAGLVAVPRVIARSVKPRKDDGMYKERRPNPKPMPRRKPGDRRA